jgi:undecaprenyl diphosphate synthase
MDGNRRWGAQKLGDKIAGHPEGAKVVLNAVEAARDLGVKALTLYSFSTENWNRSPLEVAAVMDLLENYLKEQKERMVEKGVQLGTIGDLTAFPERVQETIATVKEATASCDAIDMVLALSYGSRDEITRACRSIACKVAEGTLAPEQITEKTLSAHLDTHPWGDPDLFIRTGKELRVSNYLLWQLSYSELLFMDIYWPEFTPQHLYDAVIEYQKRERRRGT